MEHTKGPWKVQGLEEKHNGYEDWKTFAVRSPANVCLAIVGDVDRYHENDHEANARLIAAAPDLLEALKLALDALDESAPFQTCAISEAKKAIAKAEGGDK